MSRRSVTPEASRAVAGGPARATWGVLALVVAFHVFGVSRLYPWPEIAAPGPFLTDDYAKNFYFADLYRRFSAEAGQVWGYDPSFCAGYPAATIFELSTKLWERTARLLSTVIPFPVAYKVFPVSVVLSIPLLLLATGWGFRLAWPARAALAGIGTLYFWASLLREMAQTGMVAFVLGVYGALATAGILWRWLTDFRVLRTTSRVTPEVLPVVGAGLAPTPVRETILLGLAGAALLASHPTAPVLVGIPGLCLVAAAWRSSPSKVPVQALWLAALIVAVALANYSWLDAYWRFREFRMPALVPHFSSPDPLTVLKDYLPGGSFYWAFFPLPAYKWIRIILLAAGVAGLWRFRREVWARALSAAALLAFGLTYWGYLTPATAALQPLRYRHLFDLLLAIPAAAWLVEARWRQAAGAVAALGLLVNVVLHERRTPAFHVTATLTPTLQAVVDWTRAQPDDGRILLEDSDDESGHQYDFTHMPALLPLWTGRALIGGPYPYMYDRHHFAEFTAGRLSGARLARFSRNDLDAYCRVYNIIRVLCFSDEARQAFDRCPTLFAPLGSVGGKFAAYAVRRPASFLLAGSAAGVRAELNRIRVAQPAGPELILSYHWMKTLAVRTPGVQLEGRAVGPDPIPFIRLTRTGSTWPPEVEIINAY